MCKSLKKIKNGAQTLIKSTSFEEAKNLSKKSLDEKKAKIVSNFLDKTEKYVSEVGEFSKSKLEFEYVIEKRVIIIIIVRKKEKRIDIWIIIIE